MENLIAQWPLVLALVFSVNVALSGLRAGLEFIKDKTTNTVDDKAFSIVNTIVSFLSKSLDIVGYNPKH